MSQSNKALMTNSVKPFQTKIDKSRLAQRCLSSMKKFRRLGQVQLDAYNEQRIFIDRGANVLAVAHLDFVAGNREIAFLTVGGQECVISGRLDDRLGVYVILDMLDKLGVHCDVLLTDNEETGASTAQGFVSPRQYNWMFQFDRRGTDVVMYDYDTKELREKLKESGFTVGTGSFSDICQLDDLGCAGFNFGVGYYNEHSHWCHATLSEVENQVAKFAAFYHLHKDTHFKHEQRWGCFDNYGWHVSSGPDWRIGKTADRQEKGECKHCRHAFGIAGSKRGAVMPHYCQSCEAEFAESINECGYDQRDELIDFLPQDVLDYADLFVCSDSPLFKGEPSHPIHNSHYQESDGICVCGSRGCSFSDEYLYSEDSEANREAIRQNNSIPMKGNDEEEKQ